MRMAVRREPQETRAIAEERCLAVSAMSQSRAYCTLTPCRYSTPGTYIGRRKDVERTVKRLVDIQSPVSSRLLVY